MSFFRRKPREPELPPEWMVVGLGNPGPEYRGTRHNVGFDVIDLLCQESKIKLKEHKHRANYGFGKVAGVSAVLVKPMTYMNLSGQAVASLSKALGLKPDHILVIADEVHLPVGRLRLRAKGSSAGHNGHKSLIASLGTDAYPRLRIGVGQPPKGEQIDHVLSGFSPAEREKVDEAIYATADAVRLILGGSVEAAMQTVNSKGPEPTD